MPTTRKTSPSARPIRAAVPAPRPTAAKARTTRATPRPEVAELLESARWAKQALRGQSVGGGRAWVRVPGANGAPTTRTPVPVAEVARRVAAAAQTGELTEPDAVAIRQRSGLSQAAFAAVLDVPVSTLRNWEQGRRAPRGPARQLLRVAAAAPEVLRVLQAAQTLAR